MLLDADKTYAATVRLGVTTTTGDAEGEVLERRDVSVTRDEVEAILPRFIGRIAQIPPRHAALKHRGRNYYEYAREGVEIPRPARAVSVDSLTLGAWSAPDFDLVVRCGKGTYVRVLAEDIGAALGCGAHLSALRRTASGGLTLEAGFTLEELLSLSEEARDARLLHPTRWSPRCRGSISTTAKRRDSDRGRPLRGWPSLTQATASTQTACSRGSRRRSTARCTRAD